MATERLALLGDVHANHTALAAVLDSVDDRGIARGACTGDLVMRGDDPAECIDELRRRGWPCVRGNTDHKVAVRARRDPEHPKARRVGSRSWTSAKLDDERIAWLDGLPMVAHIAVGTVRIAVMHGSPTDLRAAVDETTDERDLVELARAAEADVVVMGHLHRQLIRRAGGRLFVNPGSIGEAINGDDRRPRWAWLEVAGSRVDAHLEILDAPLATVRDRGG